MTKIKTNRDLYLAISSLTQKHKKHFKKSNGFFARLWRFFIQANAEPSSRLLWRDLEEYLRALWAETSRFRERSELTVDEFYQLLASAFTAPAPPFNDAWRAGYPKPKKPTSVACLDAKMGMSVKQEDEEVYSYENWEAFVLRQIVDLREMAEKGMLVNDSIYGGIDAPRGHRWYNFDPRSFLECAMAGTFGGWQGAEESGRSVVPGPSVAVDDQGKLAIVDPHQVKDPQVEMPLITWEDYVNFLACGQYYE